MNYRFLAEHFKLGNPLVKMYITQGFGLAKTAKKLLKTYQSWGLLAHNGLDLRAAGNTQALAVFDGKIVFKGTDGSGGKSIRLRSDEVALNGVKYRLEVIYYHLSGFNVLEGQRVKKGKVLGYTGNSGGFSTGPHLHFGLKPEWYDGQWRKDYTNGYRGAVDPEIFLYEKDNLPVDVRYNRKKVWIAEFKMRFKNRWLHRQFYNTLHRHPLSITERELNALVYGSWSFQTVFLQPEMFAVWSLQTKSDYLKRSLIN